MCLNRRDCKSHTNTQNMKIETNDHNDHNDETAAPCPTAAPALAAGSGLCKATRSGLRCPAPKPPRRKSGHKPEGRAMKKALAGCRGRIAVPVKPRHSREEPSRILVRRSAADVSFHTIQECIENKGWKCNRGNFLPLISPFLKNILHKISCKNGRFMTFAHLFSKI